MLLLWGVTIWVKFLWATSRRCRAKLNQAQQVAAIRTLRAISSEAVIVLPHAQTSDTRQGESGDNPDELGAGTVSRAEKAA